MKQEIRKALMGTGVMLGDGCLEVADRTGKMYRIDCPEITGGSELSILSYIVDFIETMGCENPERETGEDYAALLIYGALRGKIKRINEGIMKSIKMNKMGPAMAPEAAKPCGRAHRRPSVTNKNRGKRFSPVGQRIDKVKREMPFRRGIYIHLENGRGPACS